MIGSILVAHGSGTPRLDDVADQGGGRPAKQDRDRRAMPEDLRHGFPPCSERQTGIASACAAAFSACVLRPSAEPADQRLR